MSQQGFQLQPPEALGLYGVAITSDTFETVSAGNQQDAIRIGIENQDL